jgi:hypothetical protein
MFRGVMLCSLALALLAPAAASAAKPEVTTGGASSVTQSTVTLNGKVDANGKATTYYFQIGTTKIYGSTSGDGAAGSSGKPVSVSLAVQGLAPATTYHYRIVARNSDGQRVGRDRTFKTKIQPLGVTLLATPTTVAPGGLTVLSGQLTGTNNANRQVQLQSSAFPYQAGFATVGNTVITDGAGNFTFNAIPVGVTTQFRVLMPNRPEIVSPIVIVGAAVQVRTFTRTVDSRRGTKTVRFSGYVSPVTDGARVNIQKLRNGVWTTVAHTRAKHKSSTRSRFKTRVRIHNSGQFRVLAESVQPELVAGAGRTVTVKVR